MNERTIIAIVVFSIYAVLIVGGIVILVYGVNNIVEELIKKKIRNRFKIDLYKSLQNTTPNWNQVKIIADANSLHRKDIEKVLKLLITEALSNECNLDNDKVSVLEDYLKLYHQEEPFDYIPNDIRIHLERLKENSGIKISQLEPLTKHIRELLKINSTESKRQKTFSIISLLIGLVGLLIGLYQVFLK